VADDGGETDEEPGEEELGVELAGGEVGAAEDSVGDEHGEEGFEEVEGEDEGEVFAAEEPGDVGSAYVSGAGFAGVDTAGESDEEAEGDGAEEITDGNKKQQLLERGHGL